MSAIPGNNTPPRISAMDPLMRTRTRRRRRLRRLATARGVSVRLDMRGLASTPFLQNQILRIAISNRIGASTRIGISPFRLRTRRLRVPHRLPAAGFGLPSIVARGLALAQLRHLVSQRGELVPQLRLGI